ncbi:acetyl-CoA C-acetyltransferase [Beggiatoa alba]|nr:acetyl-CoA C-acetyltransferase [Beggiatoa alba]
MQKASATHRYARRAVYIVDGARTPQLKARGKQGSFNAADLAIACARPLLARQNFEPDAIDEVIMGCVMPSADEANIARILALRLNCGKDVPAYTVQRNCASGLQALDNAAQSIVMQRSELVLAGGVESMSHAPILLNNNMVNWLSEWMRAKTITRKIKTIAQLRPQFFAPVIALLRGLSDPVNGLSMGQTAEIIAGKFNINREMMDTYAMQSHQRLSAAQDNAYLEEIETIYDTHGHYYDHDDGLRPDTDMQSLAKLKPVFDRPFGNVTAGNSAQVTDGASVLLLASEQALKKYNLTPMAQIIDCEWAGLEPAQMGLGPVHAITPILQRHQYGLDDIDYFEINEAFAAQVLSCIAAWQDEDYCKNELKLDTVMGELGMQKLNIDGGGVSMGHPIGASGARIVLHLLHILERTQSKRGIASLCIGGGQGGAMMVERV